MTTEARTHTGRGLVWVAAAAGVVHAAFSLYWALGGTWLLATVGRWAVDLGRDEPALAGIALGLVTLVKLAAALVPVAVEYRRLPHRRILRTVSWVGGIGLIAYGGLNTVVSSAVLTGLIEPGSGFDREAMIGHAFLWDPLFAVWGCALVGSLVLTRLRAITRAP